MTGVVVPERSSIATLAMTGAVEAVEGHKVSSPTSDARYEQVDFETRVALQQDI